MLTASWAVGSAVEDRPGGTYRKHQAVAARGRRELLYAPTLLANWPVQSPVANWAVAALVL